MVSSAACYWGGPGFESWQERERFLLNKKEVSQNNLKLCRESPLFSHSIIRE